MPKFSQIPLDLPHAGTICWRLDTLLGQAEGASASQKAPMMDTIYALRGLLEPFREEGENPGTEEECAAAVTAAAGLGRTLVDHIERLGLGGDRIGQCVRNLFECLELGEEGMSLSLRAGENPRSALRPS